MIELLKHQQLFNLLKSDDVLFQEFIDNSKESIMLVNQDLNISTWNTATEKLTGVKSKHAINKNIIDVITKVLPRLKYKDNLKNKIEDLLVLHLRGRGHLFNKKINIRINVKNKGSRYLHVVLVNYKNHNKQKLGIISKDISKELEFFREAKQNEKNLNDIFNNDAFGVAFVSAKGDYKKVNQKFCDITAYTQEELLNLNAIDISNSEDYLLEKKCIADVIAKKENKLSIEKRYIRKDKTEVWVKLHVTLQKNIENQVESFILFVEDITQQKKMEEALKESERKYRFVAEKASDIIYSISLDSKVTFYNKTIERIFETSIEEIKELDYHHLMLPKDKNLAKELHKQRLEGKKSPIFKHGFKTPKGKLVYLEFSVNPLFDEKNNVIGSLGIARDITDRELAEQKLNEKNIELENSIRTKDRYLSVIAHDLRDPFNILIGYSDLLLDQIENLTTEEFKKYILAINNASNNGFNLLKNLLDWSRTETNRITYSPINLDLSCIVDNILGTMKYLAESKNIEIQTNYCKDTIVDVDENMIKTVLRNLINNAIKFSLENSEIIVEIVDDKTQFIINVIDFGIGIAERNISKIFSSNAEFSQIGTANERGTGLGLLICNYFIKKWNGKIWIDSSEGIGSTFSFSIPK